MKPFGIKSVQNVIESVLEDEAPTGNTFLDDRYEEQRQFAGGNTLPYYRVFYRLAEKFKPKFSVELGSFQATASAHLAGGNPDGKVVTIDIHKDPGQELDEERCWEAEQYFDNLTHIKGWTWDDHVVQAVMGVNQPIDILYIDAWHRRDYVEREWSLYEPLLADKALVICDDILNNAGIFPEMEEWWDAIPYPKFLDNRVHVGVPMGFFIYKRK